MLEFQPLSAANFSQYQEDILRSEELFPAAIRETGEDYLAALGQQAALGLVAHRQGSYVGNVVGFSPDAEQQDQLRLPHLAPGTADLLYLFNIVTMPQFQGLGYGRQLLNEFCLPARQAGFARISGHFRGNGSLKNFTALGGRPLATCPN
ncbi:GNAT family N-acetyltransferase [Desulfurivibrio sp. D14AmB]|uniref:GNAT family N-acetyltransferase n=1 Tax=Desulfurivibrio sp. D14AmB TaxID=3374370 RepID=UPI00376EA74E